MKRWGWITQKSRLTRWGRSTKWRHTSGKLQTGDVSVPARHSSFNCLWPRDRFYKGRTHTRAHTYYNPMFICWRMRACGKLSFCIVSHSSGWNGFRHIAGWVQMPRLFITFTTTISNSILFLAVQRIELSMPNTTQLKVPCSALIMCCLLGWHAHNSDQYVTFRDSFFAVSFPWQSVAQERQYIDFLLHPSIFIFTFFIWINRPVTTRLNWEQFYENINFLFHNLSCHCVMTNQ